jgi:acetyl esterase
MPLDPAARSFLDLLASLGEPPLEEQTPEQARQTISAMRDLLAPAPEMETVEDLTIEDIPVRVYRPRGAAETPPILVWYHGGGWVVGSVEDYDLLMRRLADGCGALVVSVDYRLAPEHKFPAAVDDCIAVTNWVLEKGAELGGDTSRVAIGGDSAGGNLTAVVSQQLRGRFAFQVLVYPSVDLRMGYTSIDENADGYLLTKSAMIWFRDHYVVGTDASPEDTRLAPILNEDWRGLPPALLITAEFDPLRDEGELYGRKLREAGVPVTVHRYDGQIHAFFGMSGLMPAADEAVAEVSAALRTALTR